MKKITRRNFLIASGKTVGTLAAASAFMGCASPEQAENCFPRSAMPVRTDDRLTAIDDIVENYMGQGYFPGATIVVARGGKIVYEKAYGYAMLNDMGVRTIPAPCRWIPCSTWHPAPRSWPRHSPS